MTPRTAADIVRQLDALEASKERGVVTLGARQRLELSHLHKIFFPKRGKTKGDVMRYYVAVAHLILPAIKDRPLVLRRFPDGVGGEAFFQQNAGDDIPSAVRVDTIHPADTPQRRFVGGTLATLLYTIQLGAISVDPWHSRVSALDDADYTIIDLDPGASARFTHVVQVARFTKAVLDDFGLHGALKTSGATGAHIYVPLPKHTSTEAAQHIAQRIATEVATRHPKAATVKRAVRSRSATAVYVDYMQNVSGKSVAGPYALRATPDATVSTPLQWDELTDDLDPRDFTIDSAPRRFVQVGDLWRAAMRRPNTARALSRIAAGDGSDGNA
jgi:bifunctional non-homologous end joining protein LigD